MSEQKNKKKWIIMTIIGIAILAVVLFFMLPSADVKLSIGNSPVLGEENAPVTIYEFSDFSCQYCQAVKGINDQVISMLQSQNLGWEPAVPLIKENYVDTGKVKMVFKYFPGHGSAGAAHAVAYGLKEQSNDLFWEFAEKAFADTENQNNLNKMIELAVSLGADEALLTEYVSSRKYETEGDEDIAMAKSNDVKGTPTFFINGEIVAGAQPFTVFEEMIEEELSKL